MKRTLAMLLSIMIAGMGLFGMVPRAAAIEEAGPSPVSASFSCSGLVNFEVDWSAGGSGTTIRIQIMTSNQVVLETIDVSLYDIHSLDPGRTSFSAQMNPANWAADASVSWDGLFAQVSGSSTDFVRSDPGRCLKPGEEDPSSGLVFIESATRNCQSNDNVHFSTLSFVVRNTGVNDAWFSWAITTADGSIIQGGANSEPVGAESVRTIPSDLIGPQYQDQTLTVKVTPTNFDPTSMTVPPCTSPQPTVPAVPTQAPTEVPVVNSFTLIGAARACTDQSFSASWTGGNLKTVEFSLSNTSDNWTSGWLTANAASGTFTSPVDHHKYDKVMARATFIDDTTAQQDADVGTCSDTPVPPPVPTQAPVPPTQVPSQPTNGSSQQAVAVTSLPVTGSGAEQGSATLILLALMGVVAIGAIGMRRLRANR